ncbi:hypothetical protein V6N11_027695 [Hibiscus sabdariffa]|uniref:Uncharacterized protein n=1 Tax=Hibiscus sabdariffa TaxID=183260 RepID=A0ABR1ZTP2_9ROSI
MVDSTKSRFAPYVMARLALSPSRDSDRGAANRDFYKDLSTHSSYSKSKSQHGRLGKITRIGVVVVLRDGDLSRAAALRHPIPLLSFVADLTSRAAPSCSGSSDERSSSDSEKIGQTGGYPRLTSLSIKTPSQRRA